MRGVEACEAEELPYAQANGYREVLCGGDPNTLYGICNRRPVAVRREHSADLLP
ncbi:hypothetical protein [Streptomyces sp. NPDC087294]|uniref:hypothetical protein n=1 Tax=Streptomyces sp. NPDC087294 TaxID=3365777 RepID=UPI0037FB375E